MNAGRHRSLALCLLLLLPLSAAAQERDAGIVERIVGRVSWRKNDGAAAVALRRASDTARRLHVGESVRAERGGTVVLILCDGRRELRAPSGWFKIQEESACRGGEALAEYGDIGGRDRGAEESPFISPADGGVIRPSAFTLRWEPTPALASFAVRVEKAGAEVWSARVADGRKGVLASAEARRALARARAEGGSTTLVLKVEGADVAPVTFGLLGSEAERELDRQLAKWDADPSPLMRRLGRAAAFVRLHMFTDAAAEYEAALALFPSSRDLLTRTICAQAEASNGPRRRELMKRLPPGGPDPCADDR